MHPDDDEHVLEVGPDAAGREGPRPGLLEDDGHDVVPDVPLPQELRSGGGGGTGVVTGGASAVPSSLSPQGPPCSWRPPAWPRTSRRAAARGPGKRASKPRSPPASPSSAHPKVTALKATGLKVRSQLQLCNVKGRRVPERAARREGPHCWPPALRSRRHGPLPGGNSKAVIFVANIAKIIK